MSQSQSQKGSKMSDNIAYDLEAIRAQMRKKKGGGSRDPNEWRPDKADVGKPLKYKFFVLPPTDTMSLWYYEHGAHWINNQFLECPRLHDGVPCPLCQLGFDLMKETNDKQERSAIAKKFLSSSRYAVNIYFPAVESTPQNLRGKVMWFSMPQGVYNICEEVIMRDAPEAALEPEAFGIFYDPNNALPFMLEAKKKGDYNNYESSHFVVKHMPITKGGPDKIAAILKQRHDLPTIFAERDLARLEEIAVQLGGDGFESQVSELPESRAPSASKPKPTASKSKPTASKPTPRLKPEEIEEMEEEEIESSSEEIEMDEEIDDTSQSSQDAEIDEDDDDLAALLSELTSDQ